MKNKNIRRYLQFLVIVLAAGSIYPVIYLKTNYQETILQVYQISLEQLNNMYSVLGIVFLLGYFPSGLLSDRFSSKKLLSISLLFTSIGAFWFAQVPSLWNIYIIFSIWGIFSVFTFWGAHMKLVKLLAKPEEEGRFFGILDGGRGVVEAILASISIAMFSFILKNGDKALALSAVVYMYAGVLLLASILCFICLEDHKPTPVVQKKSTLKHINRGALSKIFKNPAVYLLSGIIFMGYAVYWSVYYFSGFMEINLAVDSVLAGSIMVAVLWMRPIGGIGGGFIADLIGKEKTLMIIVMGAATCLTLISLLPKTMNQTIFFGLIILCGMFLFAIRGTYWSLLGSCNISESQIGIAIGAISVMGYMPDILIPIFNSVLFKIFGNVNGYIAYFMSCAILAILAFGLLIAFSHNKKSNQHTSVCKMI